MNQLTVQQEIIENYLRTIAGAALINHEEKFTSIQVFKSMVDGVTYHFVMNQGFRVQDIGPLGRNYKFSILRIHYKNEAPPAPQAVALADMYYVIRCKGQMHAISAFAYLTDAYTMLSHYSIIAQGTLTVYELVDNKSGNVLRSSDEH